MRTQRETDLEDEIELLSEQLLASYARIDELEAALQKHDPESMGCPECGGQFDSITRLCIECGCPVDSEVET